MSQTHHKLACLKIYNEKMYIKLSLARMKKTYIVNDVKRSSSIWSRPIRSTFPSNEQRLQFWDECTGYGYDHGDNSGVHEGAKRLQQPIDHRWDLEFALLGVIFFMRANHDRRRSMNGCCGTRVDRCCSTRMRIFDVCWEGLANECRAIGLRS